MNHNTNRYDNRRKTSTQTAGTATTADTARRKAYQEAFSGLVGKSSQSRTLEDYTPGTDLKTALSTPSRSQSSNIRDYTPGTDLPVSRRSKASDSYVPGTDLNVSRPQTMAEMLAAGSASRQRDSATADTQVLPEQEKDARPQHTRTQATPVDTPETKRPTLGSRLKNMSKAAKYSTAGAYTQAATTAGDFLAGGRERERSYLEEIAEGNIVGPSAAQIQEEYQSVIDGYGGNESLVPQSIRDYYESWLTGREEAIAEEADKYARYDDQRNVMAAKAEGLMQTGAQARDAAVEGLNENQQRAVDKGIRLLSSLYNVPLSAFTGLSPGALYAVRTFGESAYASAQQGGSVQEQIRAGMENAGFSYLLNKLLNSLPATSGQSDAQGAPGQNTALVPTQAGGLTVSPPQFGTTVPPMEDSVRQSLTTIPMTDAVMGALQHSSDAQLPANSQAGGTNGGQAMSNVEMLSDILAGNGMPQTSGGNALPGISMTQGAMAPELQPTSNVEMLAEILARDGGGWQNSESASIGLPSGNAAEQTIDSAADTMYNGTSANVELKPPALMDELAASGVKYTEEDVLMVTKNADGMLMWLETGNEKAGLEHIRMGHERHFSKRGYTMEDVPAILKSVLDTKPVEGSVILDERGYEAIYEWNGKYYLVAYGTNGFVVSFYPYSED